MRRLSFMILPVLAFVALGAIAAPARALSYGIRDDGNFFKPETIAKANDIIRQVRSEDHRDVLVVTLDSIPADRLPEYQANKDRFFGNWIEDVRRDNNVSGVVILLTKEPAHLQIAVGNKTSQRTFTVEDRDQLRAKMLASLKKKEYDDALLTGVQFIKERMDRHPAGAAAGGAQSGNSSPGYVPTVTNSSSSFPLKWVCLGVGILVIVFMIISAISRNRINNPGYGNAPPPPGGYPPGYGGGGYPQGGGYGGGGGGGGGFGKGLLGGLLGGALGAWGYDRFAHGSNPPSYPPPTGGSTGSDYGSSDQTDTSSSSTGGDFGSAPDSGGGFDSGSSGGDFGGGGDSGGGSSDSGSSGGDF